MSDTIGVQFQSAGESILPALWDDRSPFLNLHLISSDTPPAATDTWPYPWMEVVNPTYQAQSIPAESITVTSDSAGSHGIIAATQWPFAAYSGPSVTVNGWWLDDRRTNPPTPLWGGTINPPYPIPPAGGMLTIDSLTITLADCTYVPPPELLLLDYFEDADNTLLSAHAPLVGGPWQDAVGGFFILCDRAVGNSSLGFQAQDLVDLGTANVFFRADGALSAGHSDLALLLRYTNPTNYWFLQLAWTGAVQLVEVVAGVGTVRAAGAVSILSGFSYRLSAACADDTITCRVCYGDNLHNQSASFSFSPTATGDSATFFGLWQNLLASGGFDSVIAKSLD